MKSFEPRSLLYCSALNVEQFDKDKYADVMVIDIEDAVPGHLKEQARENVRVYFTRKPARRTALRVNPIRTAEGLRDLLLITSLAHYPDYIVMAMLEDHSELDIARSILSVGKTSPKLLVTVETPSCMRYIYDVATSADGLIFGSADYAANLGVSIGGWSNVLHARASIVAAASFARIPAFDTAYFDLEDERGLTDECQATYELGFKGKTAVHPKQTSIINKTFTPSDDEYRKALATISAAESSENKITKIDSQMVGPPFVKYARRVIQRVEELGI